MSYRLRQCENPEKRGEMSDNRAKFDGLHGELTGMRESEKLHRERSLGLWRECKDLGGQLILEEKMLQKCKWQFCPPPEDSCESRCGIYPIRDPDNPRHLELFSELAVVLKPGEKPVDAQGHYEYNPFGNNIALRFDDGDLSIQFQDETDAYRFIVEHYLEVELAQIEKRIAWLVKNLASALELVSTFIQEKTHAKEKRLKEET